ncbi:N-acetylglutamate synthase, GNAT family [Haladaptatus litoreus]|uniref:N-acetylglutamate synthase, GNAT family n=1 Tax=Haladaptatus litoreus TaxID=553468 RepID=A0A1N7A1D8_9EURY|nr:GNAT family N-acetyltransferase [Haladaptatus litoreus]SIR32905.1 N-acetylglutamate synthase, GNAT family [Haladaptatus litoreus]
MTYNVRDELPTVEEFIALREAADMASRSREAVEQGLPNSVFGVTVVDETGEVVGMARIIGDGGSVYQIGDMAVHPDHQRQGLGSKMMERLMEYLDENAPKGAYVNLMADVEGFYEQFGFEYTAPVSRGMYQRM